MDLAASEAGLMEQSQNIVLLAATIIFLLAACRSRAIDRAVGVNAGLLCGLLFFREIEFPPTAPFASYLSRDAPEPPAGSGLEADDTLIVPMLTSRYPADPGSPADRERVFKL